MKSTVRSRNATATRTAILHAARSRFLNDGYDHAGLRAIAAEAGVDAALICRYFGTKENLFAEVLASTGKDPMEVLAGSRETFGLRVARALLDPAERSPDGMAFIRLAIRSSTSPIACKLIRVHIETRFIAPFTAWLGRGDRAADKAWLVGSILMGVVTMAAVGCTEPDAQQTRTAVARLADVLQRAVDAP